ncbi:hypothetical protein [Exiguobacterium alkaliphilum]|uniref:hypothetical protein n=1 Tax=Exiguobacterium alkaliphilum TaxID=1428684 RepID=UPI001BAB75B0|nr:hypothetical protein [Exiguobacterium alkaliphilum]QUE85104.1 hypothetical protein KB235_07765 [Exiguobacterium alkaliphilum]
MIWINLGIVGLALVGLGLHGFLLYKKKMAGDIRRVKRLTERFQIRIGVIQQLIDEIKRHVDTVNASVAEMKRLSVKVKTESVELKDASIGLTQEIKRTAGIESSPVSTESKI